MEMTQRKQKILAAVVESYIRTGEPVGSKNLLGELDFSVSSATIRNEMADLAEMGYLEQPHTSAGRVPTTLGYRYYIDKLMNKLEPTEEDRKAIAKTVSSGSGDPEQLLEKAGEVIARLTGCAAVSTMPLGEKATVRRAEIVPVGTRTAMIVLLTSAGTLKSKACRSDMPITPQTVERFYSVCAAHFVGKPLEDISTVMLQTLVASLGEHALEMSSFFVTLADLAADALSSDVLLEGQSNLFNHRELGGNIIELMEFLRKGEPISKLLSKGKDDIDIKIGTENEYKQLANSSVIISHYDVNGSRSGALGIIGPTRLNYAKLIPYMQFVSGLVGDILSESIDD
ncbi:MAG: heat-inducible transcription repressor HrcA [Clostridia bacterium]|nr:heat-inducible transcription repressor HrcA [Clostridia bacterium]